MMLRMLCLLCLFVCGDAIAQTTGPSKWQAQPAQCATCHEETVRKFRNTAHGKFLEFGEGDKSVTCGSCHKGDLTKHMETSDPALVSNPTKERSTAGMQICMDCHASRRELMFWRGSQHETANVGCLNCHSVHRPNAAGQLLTKATEFETCVACHGNLRRVLTQRSRHLFRDERLSMRMECYSCHNPHGSPAEKLISANSINEKCYACHQEKRGPFLYEHAPVRENCMTCHSPHGSNNDQLLNLRLPQLCQSCHIQGRHQTVAGRPDAMWNINRRCLNCHSQVHGTNHPSGPILQR
jgi:DmsE family decaheme c-type cytochrome